jgi:thioredoxin-like negative regulator of GroEL
VPSKSLIAAAGLTHRMRNADSVGLTPVEPEIDFARVMDHVMGHDPHDRAMTTENFDKQVLRSDQRVIIDYWAPWCGPCRMLSPAIEQIAAERAGTITVGKVNVDEQPA